MLIASTQKCANAFLPRPKSRLPGCRAAFLQHLACLGRKCDEIHFHLGWLWIAFGGSGTCPKRERQLIFFGGPVCQILAHSFRQRASVPSVSKILAQLISATCQCAKHAKNSGTAHFGNVPVCQACQNSGTCQCARRAKILARCQRAKRAKILARLILATCQRVKRGQNGNAALISLFYSSSQTPLKAMRSQPE